MGAPRVTFDREAIQFRTWLEAKGYSAERTGRHARRLARALQMLPRKQRHHAVSQLISAFDKSIANGAQRRGCRATQRLFKAYLTAHERLAVPTITGRFAVLREGYHRELVQVRGLSKSSVTFHNATVADFLKRGLRSGQALRTLNRAQIDRYVALKASENTRRSLQHVVGAMRSFLEYCRDRGHVSRAPYSIDTPRVYREEMLPRALAWADVQRLLKSMDRSCVLGERDYAMFHLMAHYGLRPAEVTSLRVDAINWQEKTLQVDQCKTRSVLVVPLAARTIQILRRYLRGARGGDASQHTHLFLRMQCPRGPLKSMSLADRFDAYAQKCGLSGYSTYSLRHGFAVRLLARGVGVKAIGDVLGHRSLESTFTYLRLDVDSLRQVALEVPQRSRGSHDA